MGLSPWVIWILRQFVRTESDISDVGTVCIGDLMAPIGNKIFYQYTYKMIGMSYQSVASFHGR